MRAPLVLVLLLTTLGAARGAVTVDKCQAGKKKCVKKEAAALLACHVKAELSGALDQTCLGKAKARFDGGTKPTKGCFAKLEKKGGCLTTGDAEAADAQVQAFVLDVVQALDPTFPPPTKSACGARKKKCVAKEASGLLACHAKASLTGTLDPKCVLKQTTRYDGGAKPTKGCFAKLEAKGSCATTGDSAALQAATGDFLNVVLCTLDPSEGTCTTSTTTSTTIPGGPCPTAPGFSDGNPSRTITSVSATVTDLGGTPIQQLAVQVSGVDLTYPGTTGANGAVTVSPGHQLHDPAFRFGDALTYARLEIPLTMATTALGTIATAPLPVGGTAFVPGGSATSGGVTVGLDAGATVLVDELTYDTADKQKFRAVELPVDKVGPLVTASGLDLALVFGMAPAGTLFCPPAQITVPNDAALPANAQVEFFIQGSDAGQQWAPFAGWTKISDGQVSADAFGVSTVNGAGFPILEGVFGVRLKP